MRYGVKLFVGVVLSTMLTSMGVLAQDITVIKAGSLFDSRSGDISRDVLIVIEDEMIVAVMDGDEDIPNEAEVIDLSDSFVLPGVMDMHTHVVGNLANNFFAGYFQSPHRATIGGVVNERSDGVADGPWAVREKIRTNVKYGVDLTKFCATGGVFSKGTKVGMTQYTLEEMEAIVDESHTHGRKVAAHAHGNEGIKRAIIAGVDSIEHASFLDEEAVRMGMERGTFFAMDIYNTEYTLERGAENGVPEENINKEREVGTRQRQSFTLAVEMGAKVVFATDSGVYPHGDNGKQFARAVRFGMTPVQAIQSATSLTAELLGWEDQVGAIEEGLYADIIAVHGDPLDDISELEDVDFVMKGGVVYKNK
jgi:imidazolonepropionase-like amidohydrolase